MQDRFRECHALISDKIAVAQVAAVKCDASFDTTDTAAHIFESGPYKHAPNPVKNGALILADDHYADWAAQVAKAENIDFIDLNGLIKEQYRILGPEKVNAFFTVKDHTHTNEAGAKVNATTVVFGIKMLKNNKLNDFLKE